MTDHTIEPEIHAQHPARDTRTLCGIEAGDGCRRTRTGPVTCDACRAVVGACRDLIRLDRKSNEASPMALHSAGQLRGVAESNAAACYENTEKLMDVDERLMVCPFCGSPAGLDEDEDGAGIIAVAQCKDRLCGAAIARYGHISQDNNEPKLIEAWNRRHNT